MEEGAVCPQNSSNSRKNILGGSKGLWVGGTWELSVYLVLHRIEAKIILNVKAGSNQFFHWCEEKGGGEAP